MYQYTLKGLNFKKVTTQRNVKWVPRFLTVMYLLSAVNLMWRHMPLVILSQSKDWMPLSQESTVYHMNAE